MLAQCRGLSPAVERPGAARRRPKGGKGAELAALKSGV